ncbi:hypothetical protein CIPAW_06G163500 [Carya illinoinensis]|uniref:Endonuclease/exonuclease/phosphatase domain-containing protein n=1 Tax=Carya illinoinensis TaxID=32201 RepID=A0A8T1QCC8_CARIL|nr:hypothetical protein CIPAW_06G163500 [Carya illinoinensis]
MLRQWKAEIICFQETKLKVVSQSVVHSLWSCNYVGWVELFSNGALGGILVMWNRRAVEVVDHYVGEFLVACHFKNVVDGVEWALAGVYGPNLDSSRSLLWEEIAGLCSWWDLPWCFGGDFNMSE